MNLGRAPRFRWRTHFFSAAEMALRGRFPPARSITALMPADPALEVLAATFTLRGSSILIDFEHLERWLRNGGFPTADAEDILKLMKEWVMAEKEAVVRWRQREKAFNRLHSRIMRPL